MDVHTLIKANEYSSARKSPEVDVLHHLSAEKTEVLELSASLRLIFHYLYIIQSSSGESHWYEHFVLIKSA